MSSTGGRKIAQHVATKRDLMPLLKYLRSKLLRTRRVDADTKMPIEPDYTDDRVFLNPQRFPDTQSARTQPDPDLPGGVHHLLASNYYTGRDARRDVEAPLRMFSDDKHVEVTAGEQNAPPVKRVGDFNMPTPTPGIGLGWERNLKGELPHDRQNKLFAKLHRVDRHWQA